MGKWLFFHWHSPSGALKFVLVAQQKIPVDGVSGRCGEEDVFRLMIISIKLAIL